jgi:hypothetical protein
MYRIHVLMLLVQKRKTEKCNLHMGEAVLICAMSYIYVALHVKKK